MQITTTKEKTVSTDNGIREHDSIAIYIVISSFLIATMAWKVTDNTIPIWDSANHLLNGYMITDIIRGPLNPIAKLYEVITASFYYPPLFYFVHSGTMLVTGLNSDRINDIPCLLFFSLAMYSLYKLGCKLLKDDKSATTGVFIFCTFPAVCKAVHAKALLDMPLTAMVFTGFWLLISWRENPTWKKALSAGLVVGLAGLTKQYGLFYFVPILLFWLAKDLSRKDYRNVAMIFAMSSTTAIIFSIWLIPNLTKLLAFMSSNHRSGEESSFLFMWFNNMFEFFNMFQVELTVPVIAFFIMSLVLMKEVHKNLFVLSSSIIFCMVVICALNWDPYQFRYILPLTGYIALAIGNLANSLISKTNFFAFKIMGVYILGWCLFNFVYLNYTPYPFPAFKSVDNFCGYTLHRSTSKYTEPLTAIPHKDWGYDWLFDTIRENKKVDWPTVCVLPDTFDYSTSGLQYLARSRGEHIDFLTLRKWTTRGYKFQYTEKDLKRFQFFVVLKNQQKKDGAILFEQKSKFNYENLKEKLSKSDSYEKIGEKLLPNKGRIVLIQLQTL